jgi:hypothetical protein
LDYREKKIGKVSFFAFIKIQNLFWVERIGIDEGQSEGKHS